MTISTSQVPILGEAASSLLAQAQNGKVLAVVNHAVYLLSGHGELFWLAAPESPRHRRCILMPGPLPAPPVGSAFTTGPRWLGLETGTKLDFRTALIWKAPPLPVEQVIQLDLLPDKLFSAVETFLSRESPHGYGLMIRPILEITSGKTGTPDFLPEDVLDRAGWPAVEEIARACSHRDIPRVLKEAGLLLGLGAGLTPSGDDFLGGLFFAFYLLWHAFPHQFAAQTPILLDWIDARAQSTNLISFTLLKDNIAGHALEPLHRLCIALLTNQPLEDCNSAALDLIKVGHSTGWSLLAGFVTGMLLAYKK